MLGSNQRPPACRAGALPTELTARVGPSIAAALAAGPDFGHDSARLALAERSACAHRDLERLPARVARLPAERRLHLLVRARPTGSSRNRAGPAASRSGGAARSARPSACARPQRHAPDLQPEDLGRLAHRSAGRRRSTLNAPACRPSSRPTIAVDDVVLVHELHQLVEVAADVGQERRFVQSRTM